MSEMLTSLERGLMVIECLAERGEVQAADLGAMLGVSRATTHRTLNILGAHGYVEPTDRRGGYRLGPAVNNLTSSSGRWRLIQCASPALADLRARSGETANLAVLQKGRLVWGAALESHFALRMTTNIGEAAPFHATAVGKAVLAELSPDRADALLPKGQFERFTPNTRMNRAELGRDLKLVHQRGWALDDEESDAGCICVAAAIVVAGRPIGAISVAALKARQSAKEREAIAGLVMRWCKKIAAEVSRPPEYLE